jgi:poly(hydroxyalkanoate) depolymerase family esterase
MAGLRATIARLDRLKRRFQDKLSRATQKTPETVGAKRLREVADFGANPGSLRMFVYSPTHLPPNPALVVALHGCTQTADAYNHGCGWSDLADRAGFVVIFPQQQPSNNAKNCFSWFQPSDTTREEGEARSIRQMIERAAIDFHVDRSRVFISGLSAGGAMASAMLATYPEAFAGGAIIAGLPYGCAASVQEAFEAMFTASSMPSRVLGDRVRGASRHGGPWPTISVWHGTGDSIVKPANAENTVRQWINVHGLAARPSHVESSSVHTRRIWKDANGVTLVEAFLLPGMSHGVPISRTGTDACGAAGPFFLDAGISSTYRIASFWGLVDATTNADAITLSAPPVQIELVTAADTEIASLNTPDDAHARAHRPLYPEIVPNAVIAAAFKAAGLPEPELEGQPSGSAPGPIIQAALKAAGLIPR